MYKKKGFGISNQFSKIVKKGSQMKTKHICSKDEQQHISVSFTLLFIISLLFHSAYILASFRSHRIRHVRHICVAATDFIQFQCIGGFRLLLPINSAVTLADQKHKNKMPSKKKKERKRLFYKHTAIKTAAARGRRFNTNPSCDPR